MKVKCVESSFLIEDMKVQTAVQGSIYTVIDAVKDPKPVITKEGNVKTFAKGWWFKFAETGDYWHHQFRFERVNENAEKAKSKNPLDGGPRFVLPRKELMKKVEEPKKETAKKKSTAGRKVGKLTKIK